MQQASVSTTLETISIYDLNSNQRFQINYWQKSTECG